MQFDWLMLMTTQYHDSCALLKFLKVSIIAVEAVLEVFRKIPIPIIDLGLGIFQYSPSQLLRIMIRSGVRYSLFSKQIPFFYTLPYWIEFGLHSSLPVRRPTQIQIGRDKLIYCFALHEQNT